MKEGNAVLIREFAEAVSSRNAGRRIRAYKALMAALDSGGGELVKGDLLEQVCSVTAYLEEHPDTYRVAVLRKLRSEELPGVRSGGVWIMLRRS